MITRKLLICSALLTVLPPGGMLQANTFRRATPPPCSADGACAPQRATWGYHQQRWRKWPGVEHGQLTPGEAPTAPGAQELPPLSKPRPEVEDQAAPPKVEALEPLPPRGSSSSEGSVPELPEGAPNGAAPQPRPGLPGPAEPAAPARPTLPPFMQQEATELPFGQPTDAPPSTNGLPFGQPPSAPATTPADDLFPSNFRPTPTSLTRASEDAPPAMPLMKARGGATGAVQQASASETLGAYRATAIPTHVAPRTGVVQMGHAAPSGPADDAPPALPSFRSP